MNSNTDKYIKIIDTGFLWEMKLEMMEWRTRENATFWSCCFFHIVHLKMFSRQRFHKLFCFSLKFFILKNQQQEMLLKITHP